MDLAEFKQSVPHPLEVRTLVLPIRHGQVLLGLKGRNMGEGMWNGFGGKIDEEKDRGSVWKAAWRELEEEARIQAHWLRRVAYLNFYFREMPLHDTWNQQVQVFLCGGWSGKFQDTDEMHNLQFFPFNELPFDRMWPFDREWMPLVLNRTEVLEADFLFGVDNEPLEHTLPEVA